MASNATFIAENTELNESLLFGIKRVGLDNWECNLPWATLSDLTSTLTAASVAATPSLTRGSVYQVSKESAGIRVKVEIQWLGTQSVGSFFTVFADELADLISVLTAVASETDEPIDLDGGASGKINEQQLPSYLQQANLDASIVSSFVERGYAGKFGGRRAIDQLVRDSYDAPPTENVPTITYSSSSTITGTEYKSKRIGDVSNANVDLDGDTRFRYPGAPAGVLRGWPASPTYAVDANTMPGGVAQARTWDIQVEFETGAQEVEYHWRASGDNVAPSMIEIDGVRHQATRYSSGITGSGERWMKLSFPDARWRRILILLTGPAFIGVKVPTGQVILRPNEPFKRTVALIGDSITAGASESTWGAGPTTTWAWRTAKLLGADQVVHAGIGGTKWTPSGSGDVAISHFGGDRLPMVLAMNPDVLIFMGSQNDSDTSPSGLAATQAAVEAALALCVNVPEVYVLGTIRNLAMNAAVRAGTEAAGRVFCDVSDAIWGTGYAGSPAGNGNADLLTGDTAQHPTFAGHQYLVRKVMAAIADATAV